MEKKHTITLEVCCGSAQDVVNAEKGGADRVELNSGLFFGGLTPSAGALLEAKARASIPVMAMVRPREAGFCYQPEEFSVMLRDAEVLLKCGADGIVFGCLHEDGSLNWEQCSRLMEVISKSGKEAVFHRAIDVCGNRWPELLDQLCELGVNRVLTSGQKATAWDGRDTIRDMVRHAGGRIEILPGGNVRAHNIRDLLEYTGCTQAHTSGSRLLSDPTGCAVPEIHFTARELPSEDAYKLVDPEVIAGVADAVEQ